MTSRTTRARIATALAVVASTLVVAITSGGAPAGADPTITRVDLGGATDALMLAPDGTGKVWYSLPGTTTYGYVSGGVATPLTMSAGGVTQNTGHIATYAGTPYLWGTTPPMMMWEDDESNVYSGSAADNESAAASYSAVFPVSDMATAAGVGTWSALSSGGAALGAQGTCGGLCYTTIGQGFDGVTIGGGKVWVSDDDGAVLRSFTPANGAYIGLTAFNVDVRLGKLAYANGAVYATAPGHASIEKVIGLSAPGASEESFDISAPAGDVEADDDGNVWFSIAGQPRLGVLTAAGDVHEFDVPAPAVRLAYDASTGRLWWSESGTAKVASIAATVADTLPTTTTTTSTTTTTTTTTAPTTTTTTAPPQPPAPEPAPAATPTPADTTAPTAPLVNARLVRDRRGVVRPRLGPASESMTLIAQIRVRGANAGTVGSFAVAGSVRELAFTVPARLRAKKPVPGTLVVVGIDQAHNVSLRIVAVTIAPR